MRPARAPGVILHILDTCLCAASKEEPESRRRRRHHRRPLRPSGERKGPPPPLSFSLPYKARPIARKHTRQSSKRPAQILKKPQGLVVVALFVLVLGLWRREYRKGGALRTEPTALGPRAWMRREPSCAASETSSRR
jgi:hypothetical protein